MLSHSPGTASLVRVPYLSADAFDRHRVVFEKCVLRAMDNGDFSLDQEQMSDENTMKQEYGRCFAQYATLEEKNLVAPPMGRSWGIYNAKYLIEGAIECEECTLHQEDLRKLKKYAQLTRPDLRINDDMKGFTLYVNDEAERKWFFNLLDDLLSNRKKPEKEAIPF